jgi:hypothetical protein
MPCEDDHSEARGCKAKVTHGKLRRQVCPKVCGRSRTWLDEMLLLVPGRRNAASSLSCQQMAGRLARGKSSRPCQAARNGSGQASGEFLKLPTAVAW